jgi:N4-gp56 family major capsid protein
MANFPQISAQSLAALAAADPKFARELWSATVIEGVSSSTRFRGLIGSDKSKMPIIKKRDLRAGKGQTVNFTTIAPVGGQGVLGSTVLTGKESKLVTYTYPLRVDLLRHATGYDQTTDLMNSVGETMATISARLESNWWARKQDDDIMVVLRQRALLVSSGTNLFRINGRLSDAVIQSNDTMTTQVMEQAKATLGAIGGMGIETESGDGMGDENEKYLFVAPANFLLPLSNTLSFTTALQHADVRGDKNKLWTGLYPIWMNSVLARHIIKEDASDGRQGTPLQPIARLGTALADATPTTITGGGTVNPAGAAEYNDYFANFPGFAWKITDADVLPTDSGTKYAMIYNVTGADAGKYEIFSYTAAGVSAIGHQITGVTRGTTSNFNGNALANAAGRFTATHPSGSLILPCTINGVILGWGLYMGASALLHATGKEEATPIENGQDYKTNDGSWHFMGKGTQGVRGMTPYLDTRQVATNYILIQGASFYPGVNPVAYLG